MKIADIVSSSESLQEGSNNDSTPPMMTDYSMDSDGYLPWELALLKWKIKEAKKVQDHDDNNKFKLSELDDSAFSSRMKVQQWSAKNDALKPCGVIKPNRSK